MKPGYIKCNLWVLNTLVTTMEIPAFVDTPSIIKVNDMFYTRQKSYGIDEVDYQRANEIKSFKNKDIL